ncbi:unnamed protein product [Gadus morhua 'NCC']
MVLNLWLTSTVSVIWYFTRPTALPCLFSGTPDPEGTTGCGPCTADLQQFPLAVTLASDAVGVVVGELYLDDGHTFSYRDNDAFCRLTFNLSEHRLFCVSAGGWGQEVVACVFQYEEERSMLTLGNLNLQVGRDWEILLA